MRITVFLILALSAASASAADLDDALVSVVRTCTIAKLEGKAFDVHGLDGQFAAQPMPDSGSGKKQANTFGAKSDKASYVLSLGEGSCVMKYDVSAATQIGEEFSSALHELKGPYYKGQMGTPAEPGKGFTAVMLGSPQSSFDLTYEFSESDGVRHVTVRTPAPKL